LFGNPRDPDSFPTRRSSDLFEAMEALGKNGVLVLASVTGGDRKVEVPADKINLEFVLGNKVMVGTVNGNREHFEAAVRDLALAADRKSTRLNSSHVAISYAV